MLLSLVLIPALAGLAAFWWQGDVSRRVLLVVTALVHSGLTVMAWIETPPAAMGGLLALDTLGKLFLSIVSALFLATALYCSGYLARLLARGGVDFQDGLVFANEPERVFTGCLLLFLSSMTLVTASHHFGLLWVAVEATTLASAPLIYYHRQRRSLEATWKYLLVCSVGIALALLGNFLLAIAAEPSQPPTAAAAPEGRSPTESGQPKAGGYTDRETSLKLGDLVTRASRSELNNAWLKAAFLFFLVGYGTKMGLAPLHTWLPDSYSECPGAVSALLSGALSNCAFLALLRAHQVCVAAGESGFTQSLLLPFGLISMGVAAVFILGQGDFKRMLAYSSVEHMGILAFGIGLGGIGVFGSMFHAVAQSLTKGCLFLVAGNIHRTYRSKYVADVLGAFRVVPISAVLWVMGLLAITGSPPFGTFLSEFTILKAAFDQGHSAAAILFLALAALIFIGMSTIVLPMVQGTSSLEPKDRPRHEPVWAVGPPLVLAALVLMLGVYVPPPITKVLDDVAASLSEPAAVVASMPQNQPVLGSTKTSGDIAEALGDR